MTQNLPEPQMVYEPIESVASYLRRFETSNWIGKPPLPPEVLEFVERRYGEIESRLREKEQPGDVWMAWTSDGGALHSRGGLALKRGEEFVYHYEEWVS